MLGDWLNFAIVILVQFLIFILYAYYEKKIPDVPRVLAHGVVIGIVIGLLFDLVLGKYFRLNSYVLGFGVPFLILNDAFSYGLFAATTLLLQHVRPPYFFINIAFVTAIYEITNRFFHVWTWEFVSSPIQFLVLLLLGYFGGATLIALCGRVFFGYRFGLFPRLKPIRQSD
jgi:hypothetical protein